jgi:hypothetical protein
MTLDDILLKAIKSNCHENDCYGCYPSECTYCSDDRIQAKSSIRKILLEKLPKEKLMYGGELMRALKLPAEDEAINTGFNNCLSEIRTAIEKITE